MRKGMTDTKRQCQFSVGDQVRFNEYGRGKYLIWGFDYEAPLKVLAIQEATLTVNGNSNPWYFIDVGLKDAISEGYFEPYSHPLLATP